MVTQIKIPQLWIDTAAELINRDFIRPAGYEITIPPIRLVHFTSAGPEAAGSTEYDIYSHELTHVELSTFNVFEDRVTTPDEVAATLAHELVHVAVSPTFDGTDDHVSSPFLDLIQAMGLEGEPHGTYGGPRFQSWIDKTLLPAYLQAEQEAINGRSGNPRLPAAGAAARDAAHPEVDEATRRAA